MASGYLRNAPRQFLVWPSWSLLKGPRCLRRACFPTAKRENENQRISSYREKGRTGIFGTLTWLTWARQKRKPIEGSTLNGRGLVSGVQSYPSNCYQQIRIEITKFRSTTCVVPGLLHFISPVRPLLLEFLNLREAGISLSSTEACFWTISSFHAAEDHSLFGGYVDSNRRVPVSDCNDMVQTP